MLYFIRKNVIVGTVKNIQDTQNLNGHKSLMLDV